jgi:hypothetical protein
VPGLPSGHDRCRVGLVGLEPWSELSPDGGGLLPQGLVDLLCRLLLGFKPCLLRAETPSKRLGLAIPSVLVPRHARS